MIKLKSLLKEASTLTLRGKNGKMVDVPRKFASIISGIDRGMSKFNPRGVMFLSLIHISEPTRPY